MLTSLEVTDFVNVSHALLELPDKGFCALTGETGVGKSLLIDALGLALGARLDRDYVLSGKQKAEVGVAFDVGGNPEALQWLRDSGMEGDGGELIVRRTIDSRRKSKSYINGKMATLAQLGELVGLLVGLCGQHEHLRLRQAARRRELLDTAAGALELAEKTAQLHGLWKESCALLARTEEAAGKAQERITEIREVLAEIELTGLTAEKWAAENDLLTVQGNAEEIGGLYAEIGDGVDAVAGNIAKVAGKASRLADLMPSAKNISEQANDISRMADDLARDHKRIGEAIGEVDQQALEQAEAFVSEVHRLARKHKVASPLELLEYADSLRKELGGLESVSVKEAQARVEKAKKDLLAQAARLTKARAKEAKSLSEKVCGTLRRLGMPQARFEIALEPRDEVSQHGAEDIVFLFAARKTLKLSDLGEVASGGELSRASLAFFAHVGGDGNKDMVFDEVDTGIGGKTAAHVGGLLSALGDDRLVLCVTHLPQVAAAARHHWIVKMGEDGLARLEFAQGADREEEIARMLAGRKITEASRNNAREILATASA